MKPLYMTVRDTATLAALRDSRFQPVSASELPQLEYEISVLSPLRRVLDIRQIKVGQHGLLMKNGAYEGLLLPQVPVERKMGSTEVPGRNLRQSGYALRLLEGREHRHLHVYSGGIRREQAASAYARDIFASRLTRAASRAGTRFTAALSHAVFQKPNTGMR